MPGGMPLVMDALLEETGEGSGHSTVRGRLEIACADLKRLLHGLLDSKGRVADEVHAIRKLCKSLRGGFSLLAMAGAGREIQAVGRMLSSLRDATSRRRTWDRLDWKGEGVADVAILALLEQQTHVVARRPPVESVEWACERVDLAVEELSSHDDKDLAERVDGGLERLDKAVVKRCRKMPRRGEEDFHEARKALKAWLGARAYLENPVAEAAGRADLAELLGDENDLASLAIWLRARGFTARLVPGLWRHLEKSRRKLQDRAIRQARRLAGK